MIEISVDSVIDFNIIICDEYDIQHIILNKSLIESAIGSAFFSMEGIGYIHGETREIAAALC